MSDTIAFLQEIKDAGLSAWDASPFLEKVTQIAPSIIYVYNQKTQSNEYSNRSLGATLGYSVGEIRALGSKFMPTLAHPDDLGRMLTYFQQMQILADGDVSQFEYRIKHKNGSWVWLLSYDTIFERDTDGSVLRHIGVAADITAQKNAEEQALQDKRTADIANEELRAFAYSVSHDMKSPSNTLALLMAELREDHYARLDEDGRELIDLSLQTVDRMQHLIEEVLTYTRIIGQDIIFRPVHLNLLMDAICLDMRADISASKAKITTSPLSTVPGCEPLLRTLFQNLIGNAIKFVAPGVAPDITVSETSQPHDDHVEISITDNGIGLPNGSEERIFGMFKRLHGDDVYPGLGLGLSLCQRITANHGGRITAHSTEGQGTTFKVRLKKP